LIESVVIQFGLYSIISIEVEQVHTDDIKTSCPRVRSGANALS